MCICLIIEALNHLDIQSENIENTYLKASGREKVWTRAGPKVGQDECKFFIIVMALYGIKSS